jgi:hypothetical protein
MSNYNVYPTFMVHPNFMIYIYFLKYHSDEKKIHMYF